MKKKSTGTPPRSRGVKAKKEIRTELAPMLATYIATAARYRLLEGAIGKQRIADEVKPLITALHKVLAGASIFDIKVTGTFEPSVVKNLDSIMKKALAETNQINGHATDIVAFG